MPLAKKRRRANLFVMTEQSSKKSILQSDSKRTQDSIKQQIKSNAMDNLQNDDLNNNDTIEIYLVRVGGVNWFGFLLDFGQKIWKKLSKKQKKLYKGPKTKSLRRKNSSKKLFGPKKLKFP
jgi:hypothetical protein